MVKKTKIWKWFLWAAAEKFSTKSTYKMQEYVQYVLILYVQTNEYWPT